MRNMGYNGRLMTPEIIFAFIGGGFFLSGHKKVLDAGRYLLIASLVIWLVHEGTTKM